MTDTLAVNEIFGPTLQGEGKNIGMPCMFLRLAGCNLACSWCDTKYAWDWKHYDSRAEIHPTPWLDVYHALSQSKVRNLVVSGGEPMLQQKTLQNLANALHGDKWHVEIETAGTIKPITSELVDLFTVSPKLENSQNPLSKRLRADALTAFADSNRAVFKFVVCDMDDFDEIDALVERFHLRNVYIMPEGVTNAALQDGAERIVQAVLDRGYNLTMRLQVALYGKRRGV